MASRQTRLSRALAMLDKWLPLEWASQISQALNNRADRRINTATAIIQGSFRASLARSCAQKNQRAQYHALHVRATQIAAAAIQRRIERGPIARAATSKLARQAYRKYFVDYDELMQCARSRSTPRQIYYWAFIGLGKHMNEIKNGRVAWAKPRLLGEHDVKQASQRPNNCTKFVVHCAFCGTAAAERVCLGTCGDP